MVQYVTTAQMAAISGVSRSALAERLIEIGLCHDACHPTRYALRKRLCRVQHTWQGNSLTLWDRVQTTAALGVLPARGRVFLGDCQEVLPALMPRSVESVCTSPPYASSRKNTLGAPDEKDYPGWVVQWMSMIWPLLRDDGSVAIVIRPRVSGGQVSDYVLQTRLALREWGWIETDELAWIKPDGPPLGNPKRPRRSWESILWFSKSKRPYCDPKANGRPSQRIGWPETKWKGNWISGTSPFRAGIARTPDYIVCPVSLNDRDSPHPMQYPADLAAWIIRLMCPPGGLVLDPFAGAGSTLIAARRTGRRYCGIEIVPDYYQYAIDRLRTEFTPISLIPSRVRIDSNHDEFIEL